MSSGIIKNLGEADRVFGRIGFPVLHKELAIEEK